MSVIDGNSVAAVFLKFFTVTGWLSRGGIPAARPMRRCCRKCSIGQRPFAAFDPLQYFGLKCRRTEGEPFLLDLVNQQPLFSKLNFFSQSSALVFGRGPAATAISTGRPRQRKLAAAGSGRIYRDASIPAAGSMQPASRS
jgi:hypothetical protein